MSINWKLLQKHLSKARQELSSAQLREDNYPEEVSSLLKTTIIQVKYVAHVAKLYEQEEKVDKPVESC